MIFADDRRYLPYERGRLLFDAASLAAPASQVPEEAHRRFRADLRTRKAENLEQRHVQLALHEEKARVVAEWIGAHGTADQQTRQSAGVLPMREALETMAEYAFRAASDRPR